MSQDKGQNQVVIDWLINGDPERVFVSTPSGSLTYAELRAELPPAHTGQMVSITPGRDVASVIEIFRAVSQGTALMTSGNGWLGVEIADDVMTILKTSGTTGQPKIVPLTSGNWRAAVQASASHLDHQQDDEWLMAMPLHHVGGLSVLFRSAHVGATVRMLPDFDAASFADALRDGVTMASVVPTMLRRLLDHDARSYAGLKAVLVGGGPIPQRLLEEAAERGLPVLPTYGMTETCAQAATLKPGSPLAYRAELLPGMEAMIGSDGRIALRGPQVFSGYLGEDRRPPEDWFVTGDCGKLEGRVLQILGRADDIIVTGGENVDPSTIEAALAGCPGVSDAMVVAIPSDEWGSEVVCLYLGPADASEMESWARSRLEGFQVPKRWLRVESLPRTELGKPDRKRGLEYVTCD